MHRTIRTALAVLVALALAGCGTAEPVGSGDGGGDDSGVAVDGTGSTTPPQTSEPPADAPAEPEPSEESQVDDDAYEPDYDIDITGVKTSNRGVTMTITRLVIVDRTAYCATIDEYAGACDPDIYPGDTIIAMDMRVKNRSGRDISFFPDQAVLRLGNEQVRGQLVGPDQIGGEMLAGTDSEGQAWWIAKQPVHRAWNTGQLRYTASAPFDADSFDHLGSEIDMTIDWPASG